MKKILFLLTLSLFTSLIANEAQQINKITNNLTTQLTKNLNIHKSKNNKIAITSFVMLNNINKTSKIGKIISENLIFELQSKNYTVIDFKTRTDMKINKNGDFIFSNNIEDLRQDNGIKYILSGTTVKYKSGTQVNARIISVLNHEVVSTAKVWIPNSLIENIDYIPYMVQIVQN